MKFQTKKYKNPFLIAEIGINHNGSIKSAKRLIDLAKETGFDAVKFQKRNPDISTPENQKSKIRNTPWGDISYLDYKKKIEFGLKEFKEIDAYCKRVKILWFASAWDLDSQKFLKKFKLKYNKVASAMLTNYDLVKEIAKEKKLTFISTGMSSIQTIEKSINIFKKNKCQFVLMHCVSTYPCPDEKLNLNMITTLKKKFKCDIGYSGHESSVSPSLLAYSLGANYIERHITLDRSMWGTDQAASLSKDGMLSLVRILRKAPLIMGNGIKKISVEEGKMLQKFKYWI
jgi:N-acetylneuraminate synthase